jgi:hypothetical protein
MNIDLFSILWLSGVGFFIFWQAAWAVRALRSGVATFYLRYEFLRTQKPFEFWMLTAGRFIGVIFGIGMFVLGLQFFAGLPK